jgi:DNA-binding NarL/FixJ family response regulator
MTPPSEGRRIRVLVVDDHEVVRVGLRTLLGGYPQIEIVGECGTATEAVSQTERLKPDLVLLDIRLPDASGFVACRQIQQLPGEARVLILTSVPTDETVLDAIAAGADGYLLKEINAAALIQAIERVAAGQSILDPAVTPASEPQAKDKLEMLSAQERRVLALVAEGRTNKEIGAQMGLSDKTVKNYLSNILDKLQFTRRSQAAVFYAQHAAR